MSIIYHLIDQASWDSARSTQEHRADSLAAEGFIHCSEDQDQLLRVANRLYSGRKDMLALAVDPELLSAPLKREPSRSGEVYPHIYGPLNTDAVVKVHALTLDTTGTFAALSD